MRKYTLIVLSVISVVACSKNDDSIQQEILQADKVIFGGVYGMCGGDCRDLYLINSKGLYKDADNTSDEYGDWSNTTFEEKMDEGKFNAAKGLFDVPSSLLQQEQDESEELIVQSWADVDYYLYIEKDGVTKELILDHIHKDASPEIKSYFKIFLESYKELGGYMIDTTNIERYY